MDIKLEVRGTAVIDIRSPDVLIVVLYLVGVRVPSAVRGNESIVAEVVGRSIVLVPIAAVGPNLTTFAVGPSYGLIHKVPDEATLELGIFTHQFPVLAETSLGITHSMCIFALDKGFVERFYLMGSPVFTRLIGAIFLTLTITIVHRAEDIGFTCFFSAFILHRAGCILGLNPIVACFEVGTITCFITKAPNDDGWMVEVTLNVTLITFEMA